MSKVLFIGPYRQNDGWGYGAKDMIKALVRSNVNVAARPIYMSSNITNIIDDELLQAEQNYFDSTPDVVIQHVLPHLLEWQFNAKNIGVFDLETNNIQHTPWIRHINLMDEVWVTSEREKDILINSGAKTNIIIMPLICEYTEDDTYKLDNLSERLNIPELKNSFIFYFIGEYIDRKNIPALITAFHREFKRCEPVTLVIKSNLSGVKPANLIHRMQKELTELKLNLALYRDKTYHSEILITEFLSKEQLISLHLQSDCFIMPSRGESGCRPLMDAIYFGNNAIHTKNAGMDEITKNLIVEGGVESVEVPVYTQHRPLPFLYTNKETWREISIQELQNSMRATIENPITEADKEHNRKSMIHEFSYDTIGRKMITRWD